MKPLSIFLFLALLAQPILAQEIVCSQKDKAAFEKKVAELQKLKRQANYGEDLIAVGKTFFGVPYVAKTLEIGTTESLVVNLQGLDCTTYVENVMAFGSMLRNHKTDFTAYTNALEHIRYENGKLDGYASRLHYFSHWIKDNEKKGLVKDITADIGGIEIDKEINFMGTHRDLYPFLKNDQNFEKITKGNGMWTNMYIFGKFAKSAPFLLPCTFHIGDPPYPPHNWLIIHLFEMIN